MTIQECFTATISTLSTPRETIKLVFSELKRNSKISYVSTIPTISTTNTGMFRWLLQQKTLFKLRKKQLRNFRDTLKRNYNLHQYSLEVNIEDVGSFDETLADKLYKQPTEHLPIFEEAAKEVADELTAPRPEGEELVEDVQIMLSSDANPSNLRDLKVWRFLD